MQQTLLQAQPQRLTQTTRAKLLAQPLQRQQQTQEPQLQAPSVLLEQASRWATCGVSGLTQHLAA